MAGQLRDLTRRVGVSVMGIAAGAVLIAGCSSSGHPSSGTTSSNAGTTPSVTNTTPAGGGTTSANTGGTGVVGDPFCTGFNSASLADLSQANTTSAGVAAWDQYAKDAPSAIKPQVQDIDNYLHDALNKNLSALEAYAQKLPADGQAIAAYYAAHCHA